MKSGSRFLCADLTIRFQHVAYNFSEGDGNVTICVEIEPESSQQVSVSVFSNPGSAMDGMLCLSQMWPY